MHSVSLNRCINREVKYYGLGGFGLVFGFLVTLCVWISSSIIFAMIAGALGYFLGDMIAKYWHRGQAQRYIYWHFPLIFFACSKLYLSSHRDFI